MVQDFKFACVLQKEGDENVADAFLLFGSLNHRRGWDQGGLDPGPHEKTAVSKQACLRQKQPDSRH